MQGETALTVARREEMSLLGLMMGEIIETNLSRPDVAALARGLQGSVGITAGKMSVTLGLDHGSLTLTGGLGRNLKAAVRGTMDCLMQISLGKSPIRFFFAGEISFSGNPFFLLRILPLIRVIESGKAP